MLQRIFFLFVGLVVLALVFAWIVRGGPSALANTIRGFFSWGGGSEASENTEGGFFSLPWSIPFPTVQIGEDGGVFGLPGYSEHASLNAEYGDVADEYQDIARRTEEAKVFGTPSPHAKKVYLSNISRGAQSDSPREEYVSIAAGYGNTTPLNITGWSLQSVVSGIRVYIPSGVSPYVLGALNSASGIQLEPGASAVIASGSSPLGISFRENKCSGYLEQFQSFTPSLSAQCPTPSEEMPFSAANITMYGDACIDAVSSLPSCRFYTGILPQGVSGACSAFIGERLSYNGCVRQHKIDSDFFVNVWRVYLDSPVELWRNTHDVIRLLDAEGRTVDVLTY